MDFWFVAGYLSYLTPSNSLYITISSLLGIMGLFAIFWAFWHFLLSLIKDYYQANLAEEGMIYSLNFAVSLIPYVFLMNWLYYKTNRNILVAIVFHISAGFFNGIFLTHPDSKIIQTILLLVLTVFIVNKERDFFFSVLSDSKKCFYPWHCSIQQICKFPLLDKSVSASQKRFYSARK